MKRMGIYWDGCEDAFASLLKKTATKFSPFYYVEIGVAYCHTFQAAFQILSEDATQFLMVGIDPKPVPQEDFLEDLKSPNVKICPEDSKSYFTCALHPIHFAVIDGCHSRWCVFDDFERVERRSEIGTIVLLHDFQPKIQGFNLQPHCNEMIGVQAAADDLGILDDSRPGWKRLPDMVGAKATAGVFERIQ